MLCFTIDSLKKSFLQLRHPVVSGDHARKRLHVLANGMNVAELVKCVVPKDTLLQSCGDGGRNCDVEGCLVIAAVALVCLCCQR